MEQYLLAAKSALVSESAFPPHSPHSPQTFLLEFSLPSTSSLQRRWRFASGVRKVGLDFKGKPILPSQLLAPDLVTGLWGLQFLKVPWVDAQREGCPECQ